MRTQDLGVAGEERIALSSRPLTVWPSTSAGQEGGKHRDGGCLEIFITVWQYAGTRSLCFIFPHYENELWQMEIKVKTKTQPFATRQLRRKEWPGGVGQRRRWWWMWVLAQIGFSAGNKVLEGLLAITITPNNRGQYCARFPTLIPFCPLHHAFYQGTQGVGWPASLWFLGRGKATDSTLSTFSLSPLLACSSAHWVEEPEKSRLMCFI